MENPSKDTSSPANIAQLLVGFLLSATGAGAGIALAGKEGFQVYGMVIFSACIVAGLAVFLIESNRRRNEQKQKAEAEKDARRENINKLAELYGSCFKDSGGLLATRLEIRAREMEALLKGRKTDQVMKSLDNLRSDVLTILIDDLTARSKSKLPQGSSDELISNYQNSLAQITEHWQELCVKSVSTEEGPSGKDTQPIG
jgi:hypothetical protein